MTRFSEDGEKNHAWCRMKTTLVIISIVIVQVQKCLSLHNPTMGPGTMTVDCGYSPTEAEITYIGEPYAVVAYDDNGETYFFHEEVSTATFTKVIPFQKNETTNLAFQRSSDIVEEYTIHALARNTFTDFETAGDSEFIVECTFSPAVQNITTHVEIVEYVENPVLNETLIGPEHGSVIDLMITNINGEELTGTIRRGNLVKLKAVMTPEGGDIGFKVSSCLASSEDGSVVVSLITTGCGTGSLFPNTDGFTMTGFVGYSPVFRMFELKRGQAVVFECTYIICSENCDGNTCLLVKR